MKKTSKLFCSLLTGTSLIASCGLSISAMEPESDSEIIAEELMVVSESTFAMDFVGTNETGIVPYGFERRTAVVNLGVCTAYPWIMMNSNTGIFSTSQHGCGSSNSNYIVLYNISFDNSAAPRVAYFTITAYTRHPLYPDSIDSPQGTGYATIR